MQYDLENTNSLDNELAKYGMFSFLFNKSVGCNPVYRKAETTSTIHISSYIVFFLVTENCWKGQNLQYMTNKKKIKEVYSASNCQDECRKSSSCTNWVWHHKDAGQWAFICVIGQDYESKGPDSNVVSGDRECSKFLRFVLYSSCRITQSCQHKALLSRIEGRFQSKKDFLSARRAKCNRQRQAKPW